MYRRWISSASRNRAASAYLAALSICLVAFGAAAQEPTGSPEIIEGPPVPSGEADETRESAGSEETIGEGETGGERVLVLPTRATSEGASDAATFDVLMASALQEIGFRAVDIRQDPVLQRLGSEVQSLDDARELYLNMKLEEALEAATHVREAHLERQGLLLAQDGLREAELFIAQVLLDLGRVNESLDIAVEILTRHPQLRLDPVRYSPAMQALWLAALERSAGREPDEPEPAVLAALGVEVGVDWVAAAVRKRTSDDVLLLVIILVPVKDVSASSRHSIELGPRASWARDVGRALEERFPPPPEPPAVPPPAVPPVDGGDGADAIVKPPWYKTWWFWTLVGVVVVGGTAGGLGGYYSSSKDETPTVTADF